MAWNDTFVAGLDWATLPHFDAFFQAMEERSDAIGGGGVYAPKAVGDDAADVFEWRALEDHIDIDTNFGYWIVPLSGGATYDGRNATVSWPRVARPSFPRHYPREFATLASTEYTDTSAFTVGDHARCIADGFVYLRDSDSGGNQFWTASNSPPDVVSTTGLAQAGDYPTTQLHTATRNKLNEMIWNFGAVGIDGAIYRGEGFDVIDAGAATTDAEADYQLISSGLSGADVKAAHQVTMIGGGWQAIYDRTTGVPTISGHPTFANSQIDFYVEAFVSPSGGTFDSNGDAFIVADTTKYLDSDAVGNGATRVSTITIGSSALPNKSNRGYFGAAHAIAKWNVAGGFVYAPL